jgi:hypothetical protein
VKIPEKLNYKQLYLLVFQAPGHGVTRLLVYVPDGTDKLSYCKAFCERVNGRFINIVPAINFDLHNIDSMEELRSRIP